MPTTVHVSCRMTAPEKDLLRWLAEKHCHSNLSWLLRKWLREELAIKKDIPAGLRTAVESSSVWSQSNYGPSQAASIAKKYTAARRKKKTSSRKRK